MKVRKLFFAAAAVITLTAAFTSCTKKSDVQSSTEIATSTVGKFRPDHSKVIVDIDGNEYQQVNIHRYSWMTSNLKTESAQSVKTPDGRHYSFRDAHNGVCPEGWSLPTTDAWEDLKEELGHHCDGGDEAGISKALRCDAWNFGTNSSALDFKPFIRSSYTAFWLADGAVYIYENSYEVKDVVNIPENTMLAIRCVRNN